jgi:Na+-translocating ferredoxin:NAD+ oxidoreductase RnfG subunit
MKKFERIAAVVALVTIILAWVAGTLRQEADLIPFIKKVLPNAVYLESVSNGIYVGKASNQTGGPVLGYAAVEKAGGYGGPMQVAVGMNSAGDIIGITIVDHKETIPFFQKVLAKEFPGVLVGKNYSHPFTAGEDIDGVSGATLSLNALLKSVRQAVYRIAKHALDLPVKPEKSPPIHLGIPEVILLLLFAVGFLNYSKKGVAPPTHSRSARCRSSGGFISKICRKNKVSQGISKKKTTEPTPKDPSDQKKHKKVIRWLTRLTGLLFLGFVYTIPLSIININSLLLGYWPNWHTNLYWYLLVVGVLLPLVLLGKSPYCDNFCPFGATQEGLKVIGGAKQRISSKYHSYMRWIQRMLAWAAIVLALTFRNPTRFNYEVFGTFFSLTGTYFQYALLAVVLVTSLFIVRPWCNYLCPLRAVADYIRMIRQWIRGKREGVK